MRNPTPVTTSIITALRGSSAKRTSAWKSPDWIQVKSACVTRRPSGGSASSPAKQPTAIRKEIPAEPTPIALTTFRGSFPAPTPFTIAPSSGIRGTSQRSESPTLSFQEVHVVHVRGLPVAEDRDQDGEAHGHFRGRDRHHEEDEDLAVHLPVEFRERHEAQVHRVQHQLDRHEDDERAPAYQDADQTDREEHSRAHLVGLERNEDPVHQRNFLFASTTAPITATRSRIDVTSNGKSQVV